MISLARWARPHSRRSVRARGIVPLFVALLVLLASPAVAGAQQQPTGRLVGRVIDAATGAGLSDVGVQVVGTTLGTMSGVDGRFSLGNVPAGTLTLQARRIGFAPKTVTGLMLQPGATLEQNVSLSTAAVKLSEQVVTAAAERGSVNSALDQQRRATQIVNSVTAEQIAKSPDGDAAQAVQRVSGVTVQDGRYVFVRGLGERYTTTSLNGARLPSPEPERKVVPLDLFPSDLLQSVTTSKTFTPDQSGDFSGAQVDIKTREFPAKRQYAYSASLGYNQAASGQQLPWAPGVGGEAVALAGKGRDIPPALEAAGNLGDPSLTRTDINGFINSFRDVWTVPYHGGLPTGSAAASVGGNDPLFGHRVGYLLSGTYAYAQEIRENEVRALALRGDQPGEAITRDRFVGTTGRASVLWGGILNLSTLAGSRSRLTLNNTYNRTADNEARTEVGSFENEGIEADIQRMRYVERSVWSTQLAGEHQLARRHALDWAGTFSRVTRDEPDRSELVYQRVTDPVTGELRRLWWNSNEGAVRTFTTLAEHSYEGRVNYQLSFGADGSTNTLKLGALGRYTDRDADSRSFAIVAPTMPESERALPPEELFGGRFSAPDSTVLSLTSLAAGGSYTARDRLAAGYAMADFGLTARLRLVGGARLENSSVRVNSVSTLNQQRVTDKTFTDLLPSLALNYRLTDAQNLRLSASRTLARPEYRELSPLRARQVLNDVDVIGNPDLVRTLVTNADLRWEWYPNPGEVLSAGVFAKRFNDPIERVYRASGNGSTVTFVNAEGADNYGLEVEARKSLGFLFEPLRPFTAFVNATVMESEIRLGAADQSASTNKSRRMVGQAPYVVNTGLTYTSSGGGTSATVLYNRVGERIREAGELPLPDVVERPRDVVDVSLRFPLFRGVAGRVDGRNLLDSEYLVKQGAVTRESYRAGRVYQVGLTWRP